jgi:hypothetical protein
MSFFFSLFFHFLSLFLSFPLFLPDHGSRWAGQAITTDSWAVENAPPRVIGRQQDDQERVVMPGGEAPIPEPTPHNQQQQKKNMKKSNKRKRGTDEDEDDEDFYESLENLEDNHHVFKQQSNQARGAETGEEEEDEEF